MSDTRRQWGSVDDKEDCLWWIRWSLIWVKFIQPSLVRHEAIRTICIWRYNFWYQFLFQNAGSLSELFLLGTNAPSLGSLESTQGLVLILQIAWSQLKKNTSDSRIGDNHPRELFTNSLKTFNSGWQNTRSGWEELWKPTENTIHTCIWSELWQSLCVLFLNTTWILEYIYFYHILANEIIFSVILFRPPS